MKIAIMRARDVGLLLVKYNNVVVYELQASMVDSIKGCISEIDRIYESEINND